MRDTSKLRRRIRNISVGQANRATGAADLREVIEPKSSQPDGEGRAPPKSRLPGRETAGSRTRGTNALASIASPSTYISAAFGLISLEVLSQLFSNVSNALLISMLVAIIPSILTPVYRKRKINVSCQRLERQVPDALDLLVVCTEAGLSLDSAFHRISKELWMTAAELAHEFSITSAELALLPDRRTALANLAKRTQSPTLRVLTSSLIQTERYGTPIAQALRVLAKEMRDQRMLKAEAKAARLPAVMTIPLIVFILPTLFVVIIGPALLQIYDILTKT